MVDEVNKGTAGGPGQLSMSDISETFFNALNFRQSVLNTVFFPSKP